ncbi:MAG: peptidylprolyl isomerase [Bacteroidia bacterium]|nr:peptidylprolyl isomerase [Bacteroidia bacterium]
MKNRNICPPSIFKIPLLLAFLLVLGLPKELEAQVVGQNDSLVLDRVVAVVGKYPVLQSDIENQLVELRRQGFVFPGDPKCYILESLLVNKLLIIQAEIDSVMVTDEEAQRTVDLKLQEFIITAGSQENLENYFKKSLLEIKQDLFKPQKDMMIAKKIEGEITNKVAVTPSEVQKFYKQLPAAQIPLRPASMEIREIVLKPMISEAEIIRIQNRLKEFRDRIQKGESFTTLAVLYSEDKGSAPRGGEMGMTPRSQLVPEFAAVAFNLKGNEISRVVKTEFGYHIIQLIDRRGDVINAKHILLSPKPTIEEKLAVRQRLDSIAQMIRENKISFEDAALSFSSSKETRANGGLLVNSGSQQDPNSANINTTWFEPQELSAEVFNAIKNLKIGEISKVIEIQDANNSTVYKILSVKSSKPAHKSDLKQDYQYLQSLALSDKRNKELVDWIEKKQQSMYIRIDRDFQECKFEHKGWMK